MSCGSRVAGALLALTTALLFVLPAAAEHVDWRPDPESRWDALTAALVPVHLRLRDNHSAMTAASSALGPFDTFPEDAALLREAWAEFQVIARDGLAVLDTIPPEPCFADYAAVERVGFLKLGDSVAEWPRGGGTFAFAMSLLYSDGLGATAYADLVWAETEC